MQIKWETNIYKLYHGCCVFFFWCLSIFEIQVPVSVSLQWNKPDSPHTPPLYPSDCEISNLKPELLTWNLLESKLLTWNLLESELLTWNLRESKLLTWNLPESAGACWWPDFWTYTPWLLLSHTVIQILTMRDSLIKCPDVIQMLKTSKKNPPFCMLDKLERTIHSKISQIVNSSKVNSLHM